MIEHFITLHSKSTGKEISVAIPAIQTIEDVFPGTTEIAIYGHVIRVSESKETIFSLIAKQEADNP